MINKLYKMKSKTPIELPLQRNIYDETSIIGIVVYKKDVLRRIAWLLPVY